MCLISGNNLLTIHVKEIHFAKACVIHVLIIALLWHTHPSGLTFDFGNSFLHRGWTKAQSGEQNKHSDKTQPLKTLWNIGSWNNHKS